MTMLRQALKQASIASVFCIGLINGAFAISPFSATYNFNLDNKAGGTAVRTLSKQGNQWVYDFNAKIPVIATASEKSIFSFDNNQVQPKSYQRQYKILVHRQYTSLQFSPATRSIKVTRDQKNSQIPWQTGVLDDLNVEIQIREDLKHNGLKSSYLIADHKDITARQFVNEGMVKVTTLLGTFDAVKVRINHSKKNKNTVFWFAPKLDYLPVKIIHNDSGSIYTLDLTKYQPQTSQ